MKTKLKLPKMSQKQIDETIKGKATILPPFDPYLKGTGLTSEYRESNSTSVNETYAAA